MLVVCERWAGDGDRLLYWPSSTSLWSWLGCSTVGHWPRAQSPLSATGSQFSILSPLTPTGSNRLGHLLYNCPPASAVLPLIYTDASLDWRLGRVSICYIYPYQGGEKMDSCLLQKQLRKVKRNQFRSVFELGSPILFLTMIIVALSE